MDRDKRKRDLTDGLPKLYTIFHCEVASIQPYGVFVKIPGYRKNGLVHKSQMSNTKVDDPSDMVEPRENVYCKVIAVDMETEKIGMSMKVVNQTTGQDLDPGHVQTALDEQRRKTGHVKEIPRIELGAVLDTTCKKCGGKGHLAKDCFHTPGSKTYDLLPGLDYMREQEQQEVSEKKMKKAAKKQAKKLKKEKKKLKKEMKKKKKKLKRSRESSGSDSESEDERSKKKQKKNRRRSGYGTSSDDSSDSSEDSVDSYTDQKSSKRMKVDNEKQKMPRYTETHSRTRRESELSHKERDDSRQQRSHDDKEYSRSDSRDNRRDSHTSDRDRYDNKYNRRDQNKTEYHKDPSDRDSKYRVYSRHDRSPERKDHRRDRRASERD